jgi:hypothetical protein
VVLYILYSFFAWPITLVVYLFTRNQESNNKEEECPMMLFGVVGGTCFCCGPCLWGMLCTGSEPLFKRVHQKPEMPMNPGMNPGVVMNPVNMQGGMMPMQPGMAMAMAMPMQQQMAPPAMAVACAVPMMPTQAPTPQVVTITIPQGMAAGMQMQVDPDGPMGPLPPMVVTIPEGLGAGMQMQLQIPPPVPQQATATAVAMPAAMPMATATATATAPAAVATATATPQAAPIAAVVVAQ